ncbi:MAG: glycoside hydrolase family 13 protein [Actinomycetota bacterium]
MTTALIDQPHHDGSSLYTPRIATSLGDVSDIRLRVPNSSEFDKVYVRYVHDGEQAVVPASIASRNDTETWWMAEIPQINPVMNYRFLLSRNNSPRWWFNGVGIVEHDPADADDFVIRIGYLAPDWARSAVVYEIFPDRFATTNINSEIPSWAHKRKWTDAPRGPDWGSELFGGDLYGVAAHLDHVDQLGANVVYLTPIFPAGSAHRYDAHTFDMVDPLLGGDAALERLTTEAHSRSMRVLGDLTLNHCGRQHEWFQRANADESSEEHGFFYFSRDADGSQRAATWLGVQSLLKLNYESSELRARIYARPDSIARKWILGDNGIDGWRIDVANMSGRMGAHDVNHELSKQFVDACVETKPDVLVVGEHFYDSRSDVTHGGWHGIMAYMSFTRPVWCWLRGESLPDGLPKDFMGLPGEIPHRDGHALVETMKTFTAGVPYDAVLSSWLILDSHDTPRFSVVTGDDVRTKIGIGLQMTLPGIPMVWAGDEIGLGGTTCGEDSRRPMPWDDTASWNHDLHSWYKTLIALRRSSEALARGSLRFIHVDADTVVYVRETESVRFLCLAARAPHAAITFLKSALGCETLTTLVGHEAQVDATHVALLGGVAGFHVWKINPPPATSTIKGNAHV